MSQDTAPTGLDADLIAAIAAVEPAAPDTSAAPAIDNPTASGAAIAPAAAVAIDYQAQATDLIEFAYALTAPWWPALENVYPPAVRKRLASVTAPLMRKYGVNLDDLGPELAFAIVALPLIGPTVHAIKAGGTGTPPPPDKKPFTETPPDKGAMGPDFSHGFKH